MRRFLLVFLVFDTAWKPCIRDGHIVNDPELLVLTAIQLIFTKFRETWRDRQRHEFAGGERGTDRDTAGTSLPSEECCVFIRDNHEGYSTREEFEKPAHVAIHLQTSPETLCRHAV